MNLNFYFMKKICKTYLNNINIYDVKKLFFITLIFMGIGFLFLISYINIVIRYVFIIFLGALLIINYKKIENLIKELIEIKKNK